MGVPLAEVIARSTVAPAREIGLVDCGKTRLEASQRLRCLLTIRAGEMVYNPNGLGLPSWDQATD